ncbi:glycosyltransferase [Scytonema sp. NUACC26]|uniref:glycosyltransferase n=1 Tax=Scytonema sp. NUACC26 TaxID=3140176 RepID=UPI0034DC05F7
MNNLDEERVRSTSILHIAPIADNQITGLTVAIPRVVKSLHQIGVKTGILTTEFSNPYTLIEPYPVVHIRELPLYSAISAMPKPLNQPNLIIFHSTYIPDHAWLAYQSYCQGIPYVICPHGGMTKGAQQVKRWKKMAGNILFFNWMVTHAVALHCLTELEATDVKIWKRPIFIVGNSVELPPKEKIAFSRKQEELQFVFIGRLDINHKGLDLLLKACSLAQNSLREARVKIHLYGPDIKGSRNIIENIIDNYQIQDFVYLHNPILGLDKHAVLQQADLFIHTSRFEGHPTAVLEAMAYGIPCLLTPGTNIATEVSVANAGWSVEPNPEAIANTLLCILQARSQLQSKGYAARSLVENKYSSEQIGMQLLQEYTNLLNKN